MAIFSFFVTAGFLSAGATNGRKMQTSL